MLKSGDKVKRVHPLYEDALIKQGGHYVVQEADMGSLGQRITLEGVDPTIWFIGEAFEKLGD